MSVSSATGRQTGISLRKIFPEATFLNCKDVNFVSCSGDAQHCHSNDLFVALLGPDGDGHEDAANAIRRGATALLSERLLPVNIPQCIVPDSRIAYGQVCQALAGNPGSLLQTIGVAGTDGKTTTAHLIESVFKAAGNKIGLSSTLTNSQQEKKSSGKKSKVSSPAIANEMARMVLDGSDIGIMEMDCVSLAQHKYAGMELDLAVISNLRGNHFGFHSSLANYRRSQLRMLDYLKKDGIAILNLDDPGCFYSGENISCPMLTIGIKQDADITAKILENSLYETRFLITAGNDSAIIRTTVPGTHHVYNCLLATAAGLVQGIKLGDIAAGLESVDTLPGRMNVVRCGQEFDVVIDESTSPYRLGTALTTLKRNTRGRVICVFSSPNDCEPDVASRFGRIAERHAAVPVVTRGKANGNIQIGERTDFEPIHQMLDGFERPSIANVIPDRIAAIEWALDNAEPGDSILVAGQGSNTIAELSSGRWSLTDADVCKSWFYGDTIPGQPVVAESRGSNIFKIDDYRKC